MPLTFTRQSNGRLAMEKRCEVCGEAANVSEGYRSLRQAIDKQDPSLAGRWYCETHDPARQKEKAA